MAKTKKFPRSMRRNAPRGSSLRGLKKTDADLEFAHPAIKRALRALAGYGGQFGYNRDFIICDLITDLMHLCDRRPRYGNFQEEFEIAVAQYELEQKEPTPGLNLGRV